MSSDHPTPTRRRFTFCPPGWPQLRPALALLMTLGSMALSAPPVLAADITLDAPAGGWRHGTTGNEFMQEVRYPASTVNVTQQSASALIRGHLNQSGKKAEQPATLVVNGVAVPLLLEEGGRFERPYAFGTGSNSVEVRSPDRSGRKRSQFYEANQGKAPPRLRVVLSWDSNGTDMDLHVVTPDGGHCFYGNRLLDNGAALDVDVTTGYGPEIFASPTPLRGVYHVFVNYYGSGDRRGIISAARVAVISNEGTPHEKQQVFHVPLRAPGDLNHVVSFTL